MALQPGPLKVQQELDKFYAECDDKIINKIVDDLMSSEFGIPPPHLLVPPAVWKKNARRELTSFISGEDIKQKMNSGCREIVNDLSDNLSEDEFQKIYSEWLEGTSKLGDAFRNASVQPDNPQDSHQENDQMASEMPNLQTLMGISNQSFEHFFQAGKRLCEKNSYDKAANVFFVLTMLDYSRFNVWISYGLCEKENKKYDQALQAYAMASLTNMESVLPSIYGAECCLESGDAHEAAAYLESAQEVVKTYQTPNNVSFMGYIKKLQNQLK